MSDVSQTNRLLLHAIITNVFRKNTPEQVRKMTDAFIDMREADTDPGRFDRRMHIYLTSMQPLLLQEPIDKPTHDLHRKAIVQDMLMFITDPSLVIATHQAESCR